MSVAAIGRGMLTSTLLSPSNILRQLPRLSSFSPRNLLTNPTNPPFLLPTLVIGLQLNLPPSLSNLLDGLLKAVPKKKTSHSRKRMRQLAGKALKDNIALNNCPGCGAAKRAHYLCPDCVQDIRDMWKAQEGKRTYEEDELPDSGSPLIWEWDLAVDAF